MTEWLIVDGYNVIGAGSSGDLRGWKSHHLEVKRTELIRDLSEYQAITGRQVYVIFDAHMSPGIETYLEQEKVKVFYTRKDETADEWIERFVRKKRSPHRHIFVATSDYLEQRMVFGQGAYRISSRELIEEIRIAKTGLKRKLSRKNHKNKKTKLIDHLSNEIRQKLEDWRRKK